MISFTATEGTFDKNLHQYTDFMKTFQLEPDYRSGAIKTASGYMLVWNQPGNCYTIEIKGKNVKQTSQDQIFFAVDGKFIQIVTTAYDSFYKAEANKAADQKAILEAHRDWEIRFRENENGVGTKLEVQSTWHQLDNGRNAILWEFDNPLRPGQTVKRQIFLATVKGDRVLLLNGGTTDGINKSDVINMLLATMSSLKASSEPTDLNTIAESAHLEKSSSNDKKKDAIGFISTAVGIIGPIPPQKLAGYLAIYIDQHNWKALLNDGDTGPYLIIKDQAPDRSVVMLLPGNSKKESTFCIYFEGMTPVGIITMPANAKGANTPEELKAAYKELDPNMVIKGDGNFTFSEGVINADDNQPVTAYKINAVPDKTAP
jgi:hypothetical protein